MSDPKIVVMIGRRIDCKTCGGTGFVPHGFYAVVTPTGTRLICGDCRGAKYTQEALPIAEFAKLFTYGPTYSGADVMPDNEIRVRDTDR